VNTEVLLIGGRSGAGKTVVGWEVSTQLPTANSAPNSPTVYWERAMRLGGTDQAVAATDEDRRMAQLLADDDPSGRPVTGPPSCQSVSSPNPAPLSRRIGCSMTTWLDAVDDPRGVRAIYGDDVPPLTAVPVHEVCLHRDGPRLVLRLDLPRYPRDPPAKWTAQGFDTVQIQLMLVDVLELSIDGWSNDPVADISLERDGDAVTVLASAATTRCRARARAATVTEVSAYPNTDPLGQSGPEGQ
jgi:hypothetical protein